MTPDEVWDQCDIKPLSHDEVFPRMPMRDEYMYNGLPDHLKVETLGRGGFGVPARLTLRGGSKYTEAEWMAVNQIHIETGIVPPVILPNTPESELSPLQKSALERALVEAGVRQQLEAVVRCAVALRLRHPNWKVYEANLAAGNLRGWPEQKDARAAEYGAPRRYASLATKVFNLMNAYIAEAKTK